MFDLPWIFLFLSTMEGAITLHNFSLPTFTFRSRMMLDFLPLHKQLNRKLYFLRTFTFRSRMILDFLHLHKQMVAEIFSGQLLVSVQSRGRMLQTAPSFTFKTYTINDAHMAEILSDRLSQLAACPH